VSVDGVETAGEAVSGEAAFSTEEGLSKRTRRNGSIQVSRDEARRERKRKTHGRLVDLDRSNPLSSLERSLLEDSNSLSFAEASEVGLERDGRRVSFEAAELLLPSFLLLNERKRKTHSDTAVLTLDPSTHLVDRLSIAHDVVLVLVSPLVGLPRLVSSSSTGSSSVFLEKDVGGGLRALCERRNRKRQKRRSAIKSVRSRERRRDEDG